MDQDLKRLIRAERLDQRNKDFDKKDANDPTFATDKEDKE